MRTFSGSRHNLGTGGVVRGWPAQREWAWPPLGRPLGPVHAVAARLARCVGNKRTQGCPLRLGGGAPPGTSVRGELLGLSLPSPHPRYGTGQYGPVAMATADARRAHDCASSRHTRSPSARGPATASPPSRHAPSWVETKSMDDTGASIPGRWCSVWHTGLGGLSVRPATGPLREGRLGSTCSCCSFCNGGCARLFRTQPLSQPEARHDCPSLSGAPRCATAAHASVLYGLGTPPSPSGSTGVTCLKIRVRRTVTGAASPPPGGAPPTPNRRGRGVRGAGLSESLTPRLVVARS